MISFHHKITLSTLVVSNKPQLFCVNCEFNFIKDLDVSNNPLLAEDNDITTLNLTHNNALTFLAITDMPSLTTVCLLEIPDPETGLVVSTNGSPNITFTTDCVTK